MRMTFGKYKGIPVRDIPSNYLEWLWFEVELREPLRTYVAIELQERSEREAGEDYSCGASGAPAGIYPGRVKSIYRALAVKWHPDRGGTTSAMQAINEFYEELKQI